MQKTNQIIALAFLPLLMGASVNQDPTRPPEMNAMTAATSATLELMAVFVYPNTSMAIINGQTVKIGEQIGEYTVTTIMPNTVELRGPHDSQETLNLITVVKQGKL